MYFDKFNPVFTLIIILTLTFQTVSSEENATNPSDGNGKSTSAGVMDWVASGTKTLQDQYNGSALQSTLSNIGESYQNMVSSPQFNKFTTGVKEKASEIANPVLDILPMEQMQQLANNASSNEYVVKVKNVMQNIWNTLQENVG